MCGYLLAKRSMQFAAEFADRRGAAGIGPEHMFYGVLRDARDPVGAQLSPSLMPRGRGDRDRRPWIAGARCGALENDGKVYASECAIAAVASARSLFCLTQLRVQSSAARDPSSGNK